MGTRTGKGEIEDPPTGTVSPGWVPLAHAKGRRRRGQAVQSVAATVHTLRVRMTPRGQGSMARPHLPAVSLRGWGDPGPGAGRRERPRPESASGLLPASGQTTGVGSPRPRSPPHTPCRLLPGATNGRGLGRAARRAEERPRFLPSFLPSRAASPPPPPPRTQSRCWAAARPRRPFPHQPGPSPGPGGVGGPQGHRRGSLTLPLAGSSALLLPFVPVAFRPTAATRKPGTGRAPARASLAAFLFCPHPPPLSGPHRVSATPPSQAVWRTRPGYG